MAEGLCDVHFAFGFKLIVPCHSRDIITTQYCGRPQLDRKQPAATKGKTHNHALSKLKLHDELLFDLPRMAEISFPWKLDVIGGYLIYDEIKLGTTSTVNREFVS